MIEPLGVSRHLDDLPCGQARIRALQLGNLLPTEPTNLRRVIYPLDRAQPAKLVHLAVKGGDFLLEVEVIAVTEITISFRHSYLLQ